MKVDPCEKANLESGAGFGAVLPNGGWAVTNSASAEEAGVASGPQDLNPNPILPVIPPGSVTSAPSPDMEAAPLFSSVDPGPAGMDFESEVSALEALWHDAGITFGRDGKPRLPGPDNVVPFVRNTSTLRIVAESAIAPANSISVSVAE